MPLTDEQRAALTAQVSSKTLGKLWDEAYRLGLLRAADMQTPVLWVNSHESDDFQRGVIAMYDAIRAEARE